MKILGPDLVYILDPAIDLYVLESVYSPKYQSTLYTYWDSADLYCSKSCASDNSDLFFMRCFL